MSDTIISRRNLGRAAALTVIGVGGATLVYNFAPEAQRSAARYTDRVTAPVIRARAGMLDEALIESAKWDLVKMNESGTEAASVIEENINQEEFVASPGDALRLTTGLLIALEGTTLKAKLTPVVDMAEGASGEIWAGTPVVSHEGEEQVLSSTDPGTSEKGMNVVLRVTRTSDGEVQFNSADPAFQGKDIIITPESDGVLKVIEGTDKTIQETYATVEIFLVFDPETPEQTRVGATGSLSGIKFLLDQHFTD